MILGLRVPIKALMFGFGFCLLVLPVWAATDTHYMLAGGAGTKDGASLANAFGETEFNDSGNWDTDEDDDNKIGQGDTVYFYDNNGNFSGQLTIQQSGAAGKPITLVNYSGEIPVIAGGDDCIYMNTKSYITIDGLTVQGAEGVWGGNIYILSSDNIIVQNVTSGNATYTNASGIVIINSTNCLIDSNTITNTVGFYGVRIDGGNSHTGNVISNNTIHDVKVYGITTNGSFGDSLYDCDIHGNEIYNCRAGLYPHWHEYSDFYNNYIHDNRGTDTEGEPYGVGCRSCSHTNWYNNRIFDNNNIGLGFYGGHTGYGDEYCTDVLVYNNLISGHVYGVGYGLEFISDQNGDFAENSIAVYNIIKNNNIGVNLDFDSTQSGVILYNNVIHGSSSYGLREENANAGGSYKNNIFDENTTYDIYAPSTSSITTNNNLYYRAVGGDRVYFNSGGYTGAEWKAAEEATAVITAPSFVDATPTNWYDFRLGAASPAIDAGADLGATYDDGLDPNDITWPPSTLDQDDNGAGWEIGAWVREAGVTIVATDSEAAEEGQATGTFRISRSGDTAGNLVVNFTLGGTAGSGDYDEDLSGGTLTILDGNAYVDQTITPTDDSDVEGQEILTMTIAADSYVIGSPSQASITIADNESEEGEVGLVVFGVGGTGAMTRDSAGTGSFTRP